MNRIVREHYPVEQLPEDLRPSVEATHARVVVESLTTDDEVLADLDLKLQRGLADLDAGQMHSADNVRAWLKERFA